MNRTPLPTRRPITAAPTIEQEFEDQAILAAASEVWPEGRKDDAGKLPYHLLAPEFLEATAAVLDFGAKKYTVEVKNEWDAILSAQSVTGVLVHTQKGSVVSVTKNTSDSPIQSLQSASVKIVETGKPEILKKSESWRNVEKLIQRLVQETNEQNTSQSLLTTVLQKQNITNVALPDALYAAEQSTCTLTIVTKLGNLEVSFAPDAITDLGFWTTVWKGLNARFNISRPQNKTGERNWELGMSWSRPFAALMRHMWAWWRGEAADPETGMSHLHHACCCLMFLVAFESRHAGQDDRP
mgnify:CR=1 FL=1